MKVTIEDCDGEIEVFEGVITTYQKDPEHLTKIAMEGPSKSFRTGSGTLKIEFRYHNGPRD